MTWYKVALARLPFLITDFIWLLDYTENGFHREILINIRIKRFTDGSFVEAVFLNVAQHTTLSSQVITCSISITDFIWLLDYTEDLMGNLFVYITIDLIEFWGALHATCSLTSLIRILYSKLVRIEFLIEHWELFVEHYVFPKPALSIE